MHKTQIYGTASFFLGNGVAGLLAYLGNTLPALVISILFTIVGIGFFFFGKKFFKDKVDKEVGLQTIVPTLGKMDSLLGIQALREAKKK